jgi:hypothetical protein
MQPLYIQIYKKHPKKILNAYRTLGHESFYHQIKTQLMGAYKEKAARTIAANLAIHAADIVLLQDLGVFQEQI